MTRASDLARLIGAGATINDGTTITTADNTSQLILTSTDADSSIGPVLELARDSASPADGDAIGQVKFTADNDAGEATGYATITGTLRDASDGTEDAQVQYNAMVGGSSVDFMRYGVGGDAEIGVIFNEGSIDADFRVESNGNANMLFVDGFLAHEVSSIVPEAISGEKDATEKYIDDNGDEQTRIVPQGIDQAKLVPLLVKTIQELEARITALENG